MQQPFVVETDTIRDNLDPRNQHSDSEILTALKGSAFQRVSQSSSTEPVSSSERGEESNRHLNDEPNDELDLDKLASDLSSGQQQLLTLAYSLLIAKDCRLILLDEPTAQVDYQSQKQALETLYEIAEDCKATVLMIAHRLETAVTYSDRVLVMDGGSVVEFDLSYKLLTKDLSDQTVTSDSHFADMVRALSEGQQQRIVKIARQKFLNEDD